MKTRTSFTKETAPNKGLYGEKHPRWKGGISKFSKKDYQSGFNEFTLRKALEKTKYSVYALGGIELKNIDKVKEYGFAGCALVGAIWTSKEPIESFKEILQKCR